MLIAVPLTGCGAHALEDAPSLEQIAAATRSDSYRFETSMKAEGVDDAFDGTATGAADPVERRGVIRYRFEGTAEEVLLMEVRRIGDETYSKYSGGGLPAEDGWSRVSTAETDSSSGRSARSPSRTARPMRLRVTVRTSRWSPASASTALTRRLPSNRADRRDLGR